MNVNSPAFKNSFQALKENISDLGEWEQVFVKSVAEKDATLLTEKQKDKVLDIYEKYSKKRR